jgi:hypothetical protein
MVQFHMEKRKKTMQILRRDLNHTPDKYEVDLVTPQRSARELFVCSLFNDAFSVSQTIQRRFLFNPDSSAI